MLGTADCRAKMEQYQVFDNLDIILFYMLDGVQLPLFSVASCRNEKGMNARMLITL